MAIFLGIALLAVSFLLILIIYIIQKESEDVVPSAVLGALVLTCLIGGIGIIHDYCSPSITPIDVYRGRTTLEITYKDSIAIDSVVVWKEEK